MAVRDLLAILKICEVSIRTQVRETLDKDLQLFMYAGVIVSATLVLAGAGSEPGAYQYGVAALNGGDLPVRRTVETITVSLWVFGLLVFVFESATDQESVDREFLLVNTSEWAFVLGRSLARFAKYGDWIIAFSIIASGLFALGARSVFAFITLTGGVLLTYLSAALLGSLLGSIVRYVNVRSGSENTLKYGVAMGGLLAYFLLFLNREQLYADVLASPISWYTDLLLLGVTGVRSDLGAAGIATAVTVLGIPLLAYAEYRVMLAVRNETDLKSSTPDETEPFTIEDTPSWVPQRYYRAVKTFWGLPVRRPRTAIFVMTGPAIGYYLWTNVLQSYSGGLELAAISGLALAAGAGPTLNLIGNEANTLTQHLTTQDGKRILVRSYIGGTLIVAFGFLVAVVGGLSYLGDTMSVWRIVGAVALTGTAPFLSLTAGLLFSGYSKTEDGERTNYIPHILALMTFVGSMSAVAMPFLVGSLRPDLFVSYLSFASKAQAEAVGAAITLVAGMTLAGICYWYSVNNIQKRYVELVF